MIMFCGLQISKLTQENLMNEISEIEKLKKENKRILNMLEFAFELITELGKNQKILFGLIILDLTLVFLIMFNVFKWMH